MATLSFHTFVVDDCTVQEETQMIIIIMYFHFHFIYFVHVTAKIMFTKEMLSLITNSSTSPKLNYKSGVTYNNTRSIQFPVAYTATKQ